MADDEPSLIDLGAFMGAPLPERLGPYRLEGELGRGGMATVYRAVHADLGRPTAIKVLSPSLAMHPGARRRWHRERQVQAGLTHPSLVAVFDAGEADGRLWMAMELVDGATLEACLGNLHQLDVAEGLWVARELLAPLAYLHGRGLIHRDLKPSNVMLTRDGRLKLMDLGLVQTDDATRITKTGELLGTPLYVAPEVLLGEEWTPRADLFQFGAVVYESLAGAWPFRQLDVHRLLRARVADDLPPLTEVREDVPAGLTALLGQCLARAPGRRPAHAEAVQAALEPLLRAAAPAPGRLAADPERQRPRPRPAAPRPAALRPTPAAFTPAAEAPAPHARRPPTAAAAAVVLALAVGLGLFARGPASPSAEAPDGPQRPASAPTAAPVRLVAGPFLRVAPGFAEVTCRLSATARVEVSCSLDGGPGAWSAEQTSAETDAPRLTFRPPFPVRRQDTRLRVAVRLPGASGTVRAASSVALRSVFTAPQDLSGNLLVHDAALVGTDVKGRAFGLRWEGARALGPTSAALEWLYWPEAPASMVCGGSVPLDERLLLCYGGARPALHVLAPAVRRSRTEALVRRAGRRALDVLLRPLEGGEQGPPRPPEVAALDPAAGERSLPLGSPGLIALPPTAVPPFLYAALHGTDSSYALAVVDLRSWRLAGSFPLGGPLAFPPWQVGPWLLVCSAAGERAWLLEGRAPGGEPGWHLTLRGAYVTRPTLDEDGRHCYLATDEALWRLSVEPAPGAARALAPALGEWTVPARGAFVGPTPWAGRLWLPRKTTVGSSTFTRLFLDSLSPSDAARDRRETRLPLQALEQYRLSAIWGLGLRGDLLVFAYASCLYAVRLPAATTEALVPLPTSLELEPVATPDGYFLADREGRILFHPLAAPAP